MATSNLIIYEPLGTFGLESEYWKSYIEFYELYWGGPTSPFGVWFGNEYKNFRKSLSERINVPESDIKDCYFLKDDDGSYFIAPIQSDIQNYLIYIENIIPVEWFLLFREDERKSLFSHWGFNAIYYSTKLQTGLSRVESSKSLFQKTLNSISPEIKESEIISILSSLIDGCEQLINLLSGYNIKGHIILNYGEICSYIHTYTLDNEKSVKDICVFIELLKNSEYEKANTAIKILFQKWNEIFNNASGQSTNNPVQ
jgi:hypothetical protein